MPFTAAEKQAALRREVNYRERVYARLVADGRMQQADAERGIAIMKEIKADYTAIAEAEAAKTRLL